MFEFAIFLGQTIDFYKYVIMKNESLIANKEIIWVQKKARRLMRYSTKKTTQKSSTRENPLGERSLNR